MFEMLAQSTLPGKTTRNDGVRRLCQVHWPLRGFYRTEVMGAARMRRTPPAAWHASQMAGRGRAQTEMSQRPAKPGLTLGRVTPPSRPARQRAAAKSSQRAEAGHRGEIPAPRGRQKKEC